jgi:hypothetical protein
MMKTPRMNPGNRIARTGSSQQDNDDDGQHDTFPLSKWDSFVLTRIKRSAPPLVAKPR